MEWARLASAHIDYDDAIRRCAGDEELYEDLLRLMVDDTHFAAAKQALEEGDYDALFSNCHEIKGMSGTVSFTKVYELSSEIVALYRAQDFEAIPAVFATMEAAYNDVIELVREVLDS